MTKFIPSIFSLIILVSLLLAAANAQVSNGELVRVRTLDGSKVIGTVSEVTIDGLGLSFPGGGSQNISYGEIETLHRSIGRRTYRLRSALIGAGTGVLLGIGLGFEFGSQYESGLAGFLAGTGFSILLGTAGVLVGVIIGSFIKGEKWQEISAPYMGFESLEPRTGFQASGSPVLGVQLVF